MGSDGWDLATDPSYSPFLYRSNETLAERIYVLASGMVLVGGSNLHVGYIRRKVPH